MVAAHDPQYEVATKSGILSKVAASSSTPSEILHPVARGFTQMSAAIWDPAGKVDLKLKRLISHVASAPPAANIAWRTRRKGQRASSA
jgi:hypothetical protein